MTLILSDVYFFWVSARFECIELFIKSWISLEGYQQQFVMKSYKFNLSQHTYRGRELKLMILKMICIIWRNFMIDYRYTLCDALNGKNFFILYTMTDVIVLCVYFHMTKMMNNNIKNAVVVVRCVQKVIGMLWNSFYCLPFTPCTNKWISFSLFSKQREGSTCAHSVSAFLICSLNLLIFFFLF